MTYNEPIVDDFSLHVFVMNAAEGWRQFEQLLVSQTVEHAEMKIP